jgi:hypothetical protein
VDGLLLLVDAVLRYTSYVVVNLGVCSSAASLAYDGLRKALRLAFSRYSNLQNLIILKPQIIFGPFIFAFLSNSKNMSVTQIAYYIGQRHIEAEKALEFFSRFESTSPPEAKMDDVDTQKVSYLLTTFDRRLQKLKYQFLPVATYKYFELFIRQVHWQQVPCLEAAPKYFRSFVYTKLCCFKMYTKGV